MGWGWRKRGGLALGSGMIMLLTGCGFADRNVSLLPAVMRDKEVAIAQPDPEPDVKKLVRDNLAAFYLTSTKPHNIRFSAPRRDRTSLGWVACVRANVTSLSGIAIANQTHLITINDGKIRDRHRAEPGDICASETYQPL